MYFFVVVVAGGGVKEEGFGAKALEKRLPFVVRARMPLARRQHGLGQRGAGSVLSWLCSALPG